MYNIVEDFGVKKRTTKYIIIGGSGYIGSHLIKYLLNLGHSIINVDLINTDITHTNLTTICTDIRKENCIKEYLCNDNKIIYLAGVADINFALDSFFQTVNQNILAFINILEQLEGFKIHSFNYISSVYADSNVSGIYGASKKSAELIIEEYSKFNENFKFNIFRIGSVYGGQSNPTNGVHRLIANAVRGKQIWFQGPADTCRRFIHINDLTKIISDYSFQGGANEKFIVAGKDKLSIDAVCKLIEEYMQLPTEVRIDSTAYEGHYVGMPYRFEGPIRNIQLNEMIEIEEGLRELLIHVCKLK